MESQEIYMLSQLRDQAKVELDRLEKQLEEYSNDDHNNTRKIELEEKIADLRNDIEEYNKELKELAVSKPISEDAKESKKLIPDNSSKIEQYERVISCL
jgi:chromosome segregation ATPase